MLRITAISAGAVEYLIEGSGCRGHKHAQDLDRDPAATAEQAAGADAERHGQGPAYFDAAVGHGEPAGRWFGSGLEAMQLGFRSGEEVDPDDVRAIFGQLRYPSVTDAPDEDPVFLGRRPPQYKTEQQRYAALVAKEPGGVVTEERGRELRELSVTDGRKGVAYYDFTFSAPKSVSVYWAALLASGAEEQAAAVAGAHERAVEIAIAYGDQHLAYTRTGWHGRTTSGNESVGKHEAGRGTVWTLWRHSTSRENEPQLHTHAALLNRTITAAGKILALDGAAFRAYKEAIATAYERALEQEVSAATGVRFELRPDGVAREIAGVDPELMAEASSRRGQVTARVAEMLAEYRSRTGREPSAVARKAMADMATLDTRVAKGAESGPAGVAAWGAERVERLVAMLEEVEAAGHDVDASGRPDGAGGPERGREPGYERGHAATAAVTTQEVVTGVSASGLSVADGPDTAATTAVSAVSGETLDRSAVMAAAIEDVQARYAVWTIGNLAQALDARLGDAHELGVPAAARPQLLEDLTREALRRTNVVLVSAPDPVAAPAELRRADGGSLYRRANGERYATAEHLATEDRVLAQAGAGLGLAVEGPELEMLRVELAAASLSGDQVNAVAGIVGSGRVGDVLVGPAGSGKSRTVGELARVWAGHTGGRVLGVATSEIATRNLAGDGLRAINSTRFLQAFDPESGTARDRLRPGDMVIVDEAGMSSTRDLAAITALCSAAGAKVVYTGDPHQLDAVEAGGLFAYLVRTGPHHELVEVHRFRERWEREASLQLRAGDVAAVDAYGDRGRLRTGTVEEMQEQASRAYLADTVAGKSSLLIVGTNTHAAELSRAVREQLMVLGVVQGQEVAKIGATRQPVSVGDRVQARLNDYQLRVDPEAGPGGRAGLAEPVTNRALYTVVGVDDATGDLLVRDRHGAVVHLPRAYFTEHLSLAYAVTVHAAQGVTVDTGYPVVDRDWALEALYPAATRGREQNILHLVTERAPDAHEPQRVDESARERMAKVLTTSSAQQAASHVRDRGAADAASLTMAAAQWDAVAADFAWSRYTDTLVELLGEQQAEQLSGEAGYGRLLRAVREAEMAGHNAEAVLTEAVTERGFAGAESVSDVVRWRLRGHVANRQPEQAVDPRDWTTLAAPLDGAIGEYAQALAVLATDRQHELGRQVAQASPLWATQHLGAVPDEVEAPAERAEWERRAGIAAAYRELHQVPDEQVSLGAAPSREYEFHRALWGHAREALGRPADVTDHEALTDAQLYAATERWAREVAAAPEWVADRLSDVHLQRHRHEVDFRLAAAELDHGSQVPGVRRDVLVERLEEARGMVDVYTGWAAELEVDHQLRAEWAASTRDLAVQARQAAEELARRDLPAERAGGPEQPGPERSGADPEHEPQVEDLGAEPDVRPDVGETVEPDPTTPVADPVAVDVDEPSPGASAGSAEPVPDAAVDPVGPDVVEEPQPAAAVDVGPSEGTDRSASGGSTPEVDVPEVDVPEVDVPEVDVPEVDVPEVDVPEVQVPEPTLHDVAEASQERAARERGREQERQQAAQRDAAEQQAAADQQAQTERARIDVDTGVDAGQDLDRGQDLALDQDMGPGLGLD